MKKLLLSLLLSPIALFAFQPSAEYSNYINELKVQAKAEDKQFKDFDAKKGKEIFFAKKTVNGEQISCATCHTQLLTNNGKNVKTNKSIEPLAPSVNHQRLTSKKEMQKWLRRNFNDVYQREGTAKEKGDVLTFISNN